MKTAKLRIFNSFIASFILNIVLMFLVVWLFTPEVREKLTSSPIEVSITKIRLSRHPPIFPGSIGNEVKLPYMHKTAAPRHPTIKSPDLTSASSPETDLTPAETALAIASDLALLVDYNRKSSNLSIELEPRGRPSSASRKDREDELKFGVNLLVYVLLNSPIVSHQP